MTDPCLKYYCLLSSHTEVAVQKVTDVEERELREGSRPFYTQTNSTTVLLY